MASPAQPVVWRAFFSRATVVTAVLAVVVWGFVFQDWWAGIVFVLLLYVHELGHVLAALVRRVPVEGPPLFIPGFGAFVRVRQPDAVWDDVLVSLSGPLVGGFAALALHFAGSLAGASSIVQAAAFAFFTNLLNLLPFKPLDGGRIIARTGWLGFVPAAILGVALLILSFVAGLGPLLVIILVFGLIAGARSSRAGTTAGRGTRTGILAVYLLAGLVLVGAFAVGSVLRFSVPALVEVSRRPVPSVPVGEFRLLSGITAGPDGVIYTSEGPTGRIQKFTPEEGAAGRWEAFGRGLGRSGYLSDLAVDPAGNVYVSDLEGNLVHKLSPTGEVQATWAGSETDAASFWGPAALAADQDGNVYVSDLFTGQIVKLSPEGSVLATWQVVPDSGDEPEDEEFVPASGLAGLAIDRRGTLFTIDRREGRVVIVSPDGQVTGWLDLRAAGQIEEPNAVAVDGEGTVYVTDGAEGRVVKLSPEGRLLAEWAAPRAVPGVIPLVEGIDVAADGSLVVAGWGRERVAKLSLDGDVLAQWGADLGQSEGKAPSPQPPHAIGPWRPFNLVGLIEWLAVGVVALGVIDFAAYRFALRPDRGSTARYLAIGLFGWPRLLLGRQGWPALVQACLVADILHLPGLVWLEVLVRSLAGRHHPAAGSGFASGFDYLRRQGRGREAAWRDRLTPCLRDAGPGVVIEAFRHLVRLDQQDVAYTWLVETLVGVRPEDLDPGQANDLGYALLLAGRAAEALPFAERAAAALPESGAVLGTLGETRLALGDAVAAEELLRASLAGQDYPVNRLALGRALVAQGRYAEALEMTQQALEAHSGPWRPDEPDPAIIAGWLNEWRTAAQAGLEDSDAAPSACVRSLGGDGVPSS